jgi:hypothetical protein
MVEKIHNRKVFRKDFEIVIQTNIQKVEVF